MTTLSEKIEIMKAYQEGRQLEVRILAEQSTNWYQVVGEPFWNWVNHEWRIANG